jgi:hypothetical protein
LLERSPYGAFVHAIAEMIGIARLGRDDFFTGFRMQINDKARAVFRYATKN